MAVTRELEDGAKLLRGYLTFTVMGSNANSVQTAANDLKSFYLESRVKVADDSFIVFRHLCHVCQCAMTQRQFSTLTVPK